MASQDEQAFLARISEVIDLCNEQAESAPADQVSMSTLYAAARYCAWRCSHSNSSGQQMAARREEAMRIFRDQFQRMFAEAYDEIAADFTANSQ